MSKCASEKTKKKSSNEINMDLWIGKLYGEKIAEIRYKDLKCITPPIEIFWLPVCLTGYYHFQYTLLLVLQYEFYLF